MQNEHPITHKRSTQSSIEDWVDHLLTAIYTLVVFKNIPLSFPFQPENQNENNQKIIEELTKINPAEGIISNDVKERFINSLINTIKEIGGKQCFPHHKPPYHVPMEIIYPLAGGRGLWHVRDPRCKLVCDTLKRVIEIIRTRPSELQCDSIYIKACLEAASFDDINQTFLDFLSKNIGGIPKDIPHFEKHLQRCLLSRTLFHFSYSFS